VSVIPTGGHSGGHQGVLIRGDRTVAFFGDLFMRPWALIRSGCGLRRFPLDSVAVKAELFGRAADENWTIVLSHELCIRGRLSATETA